MRYMYLYIYIQCFAGCLSSMYSIDVKHLLDSLLFSLHILAQKASCTRGQRIIREDHSRIPYCVFSIKLALLCIIHSGETLEQIAQECGIYMYMYVILTVT